MTAPQPTHSNSTTWFAPAFDAIASAPGGVARLRELILSLAVQGRLVPQDDSDEPASELLKRIATEKALSTKGAKVPKGATASLFAEEEIEEVHFEIPATWEWTQLGDVSSNIHYGYTASSDAALRDVRLLRITDIQDNKVEWDKVPGCEIDARILDNYRLNDNDILIARTGGTIGKSFLVDNVPVCAVFASYLIRVTPSPFLSAPYIKLFLGSGLYWAQLYEKSMGTGQPNVNGTALRSLILPLPPLAEQKRIVARVDELMALCDELDARQTQMRLERGAALTSTLNALSAAREPDEFNDQFARLMSAFDTLFDAPESIASLRAAILQLAVQGRLVPQNEEDEPASTLLEHIAEHKAELVAQKKLRKSEPLPPIEEDEARFETPTGWQWTRLGDLILLISGQHLNPEEQNSKGEGLPYLTGPADFGLRNPKATRWTTQPKTTACSNDILLTVKGAGVGKINVLAMEEAAIGRQLMALRPYHVDLDYIYLFMGNAYQQFQNLSFGMTVPGIGREDILHLLIPLPPLAEQKRIVERVDELMALCDSLEAQLKASDEARRALAESAVKTLSQGTMT